MENPGIFFPEFQKKNFKIRTDHSDGKDIKNSEKKKKLSPVKRKKNNRSEKCDDHHHQDHWWCSWCPKESNFLIKPKKKQTTKYGDGDKQNKVETK